MPVYEYSCQAGHRFEVKQKMSDAPITNCQVCDLPVTKVISASAISFKGTGWYLTDYSDKLKPPPTEEKTSASPEKKEPATTTSSPNESKPAATTPSPDPKSSASSSSRDSSNPTGSTTGS
jgi:putative FmdB family regulatory protein